MHSFPASNAMFGPRKLSFVGRSGSKADAAPLVLSSPIDGCTTQTLKSSEKSARSASDASVTGSVVIVERGSCAFASKVYAAQKSGASGVIVVNNQRAELFMMGGDGTARQDQIRIPSVMVSAASGAAIRSIVRQSAANGNQLFVSFGEHQFELTAPDERQLKSKSSNSLSVFAGGDPVAQELGLRSPIAWGSCTEFFFHGMSDWGIHVSRLTDGNYQLMLVGERVCRLPRPFASFRPPRPLSRCSLTVDCFLAAIVQFDGLGTEKDPAPAPAPTPAAPRPAPAPQHKGQSAEKRQTGVAGSACWVPDRWPGTHKCHTDADCGVDENCGARRCSRYGFCTS